MSLGSVAGFLIRGRSSIQREIPTREEAQRVAQEILSRPEYREHENPIQELRMKVLEWLAGLFGDLFGGAASYWGVAYGIIKLIFFIAAIVLLVRLLLSGRRTRSARAISMAEAAKARAKELRLEARAAREAGDLLLALRLSFFALVVGLGERGDLHYRAGWTNRELLERGDPSAEVAEVLTPLVAELDERSFGGVHVEDADVDRFEDLCERWLDGAVQP